MDDTRAKLIAAAAPLFARKGFAAVSIREVAIAAEANVAAISYHFGGKEALYCAVLEDQFAPVAELLQRVNSIAHLTPEERLLLYATSITSIHHKRPYFIRFISSEMTNPTTCFEVVQKYISQAFRFLCTALEDGVAQGQFKPDLDIGFAAMSLAGILNFYFIARTMVSEFMPTKDNPDDAYNRQAFAIYMDGIRRR